MNNCDNCSMEGSCSENKQQSCRVENNPANVIKNVIGVMSGKGGVGKSTVSTLLAYELMRNGYKVGLMDADITGPSIPRLLHLHDKRITSDGKSGMYPVTAPGGLKVMSSNFLLEREDLPIIFRGPALSGIIEQFWKDVLWKELDYLIVDLPPGTADVTITTMQSLPMSGIVMVTVPHDMVSMIVSKAVNMASKMEIPVLGIVENMSYTECPDCGKKIQLFNYRDDEYLTKSGIDILCRLPMSTHIIDMPHTGIMGIPDSINSEVSKIVEAVLKSSGN